MAQCNARLHVSSHALRVTVNQCPARFVLVRRQARPRVSGESVGKEGDHSCRLPRGKANGTVERIREFPPDHPRVRQVLQDTRTFILELYEEMTGEEQVCMAARIVLPYVVPFEVIADP
jgi:hypothetical protein